LQGEEKKGGPGGKSICFRASHHGPLKSIGGEEEKGRRLRRIEVPENHMCKEQEGKSIMQAALTPDAQFLREETKEELGKKRETLTRGKKRGL